MNPNSNERAHWKWATACLCMILAVAGISRAHAHGFAGKRFFPATLSTDDPFVADELSLPTITSRKLPASGDDPAARETDYAIDFTKRITPNLGIGLGATYKRIGPDGADAMHGFDNLSASVKTISDPGSYC